MGNIIGEGFAPFVVDQIKQRQSKLAQNSRQYTTLVQQNSNSAWIRLTSGVYVLDEAKFGFPAEVGRTYSLFGGTLKNNNTLGGLQAYKEFSYEQGYRPAPGIISFTTKNKNRGSLRESSLKLRAYDREQFELIDILYLRLGYSVFIEFGNSIYFDNNGEFTNATNNLVDFLDAKYSGNPQALFADIETKRRLSCGNYDGIFGRISNFEWVFTSQGYYDITLTVMSYGDVIEALKANSAPEDFNAQAPTKEESQDQAQQKLQEAETDAEVIDVLKNVDSLGRLAWSIKKQLDTAPGIGTDNHKILSSTSVFGSTAITYKTYDAAKVHNAESNLDYYYVRFGALLQYLADKQMLYIDATGTTPLIVTDLDEDTNLIFKTPYTISSNPGLCFIRTKVTVTGGSADFDGDIFPAGASFDDTQRPDAGKLMNVYVNLAYIIKQSYELRDSKNKTNYIDLINKILGSIESSLGGRNTLKAKVSEDLRFYIIDEHPIPSIQREQVENPNFTLKLYGLNPGEEGSFVRDFGIKTSITNELASTITIGAQASGQIKGEDATAFSKWNKGLVDRILPIRTNEKGETEQERKQRELQEQQITERNKDLASEYVNYLQSLQNYSWDAEKADSFATVLTNYLSFTEGTAAESKGGSTGVIGFIPIDLNFTIDGISGIKIYQSFSVNSSFLPRGYGETMQFIITGISHEINNNTWTTHIETNLVPASVIVSTNNQNFLGLATNKGPTGTQGNIAPTAPGTYTAPVQGTVPVRLVLRRKKEVYIPGASTPNGTGQTLGDLELYNPAGQKVATLTSVELPWRGNQNGISCIPPGRYNFSLSKANNNPAMGQVLRLDTNGTGRNGVLVHVGTTYRDTHGCILPGLPSQIDRNGDSVPDNKPGSTSIAMKKIIDTLYPPGVSPETTYAIEVYGIPGKQYIQDNPKILYTDPTSSPAQPQVKSREYYIYAAGQLKKVLELKDAYDNNRPLLQAAKGTFNDNETQAVIRLQALINARKQTIDGSLVSWQNKLPLAPLSTEHKRLFIEQFTNLTAQMQNSGTGQYVFKYPDKTRPDIYSTSDNLSINVNF